MYLDHNQDEPSALDPDWVEIPAGPFLHGASVDDRAAEEHEQPQQTCYLPLYCIGRYPVTNAQFRLFVEDGGYTTDEWWTAMGLQERERRELIQPRSFDDPRFKQAAQPVVGVNLYEALAYCAWLSAKLGYPVRLPSDAEWEKAARGVDGRIYPWGNEWQESFTNAEDRFGQTSPVGMFPQNASPYGVLDMSGNSFDWTLSTRSWEYYDPVKVLGVKYINNATPIHIRGGAWNYAAWYARSTYRTFRYPCDSYYYLGFRLLTTHIPS